MNQLEAMAADAAKTGRLWLGGEMEIPVNDGPQAAFRAAFNIAEQCGYMVSWKYGHSAIAVSGGDIVGEYVLDWFRPEAQSLVKIERWTSEAAYVNEQGKAVRQ